MSSSPAVSVVVPTYRRLTFLPQALESALAQTWGDFEVVLTDNGPSPEVEELARSYGDPRIRYRHNGGNIGLQPNVLAGYRAGRGALLATLHDDDVWEPDFLARLVPPLLSDDQLAIAFCDYSVTGPDGTVDPGATELHSRREGRRGLAPGAHRDARSLAVVEQSIQVSYAAVFRADLDLAEVPDGVAPLYDLWIAYLATRDGRGAWYCPERLTRYRHHGGSATSGNPFYRQEVESFSRFLDDPRLAALRPALRRKKALALAREGMRLLLDAGQPAQGRRTLVESVRTSPGALGVGALVASAVPGGPRLLAAARARQHRRSLTV